MAERAEPNHRVVAGLLFRHGRALLCHRSPHRHWYPDTWDLPGGHVEEGEEPPRALTRELWEELGITVMPPTEDPLAQVQGPGLHMDVWLIEGWTGQPSIDVSDEHDALAWVNAEEARGLQLADPRIPVLIEAALP